MIKYFILAAAFSGAGAVETYAQSLSIYDKCIKAVQDGSKSAIVEFATVIKSKRNVDPSNFQQGEQCLEAAFSKNFSYDTLRNRWVDGKEADIVEERNAIDKKRRDLIRKSDAVEKVVDCYKEKLKGIQQDKEILVVNLQKRNQNLISKMVGEACASLHEKDPQEAILDITCREYFSTNMHPDLEKDDIYKEYEELDAESASLNSRLVELLFDLAALERELAPLGSTGVKNTNNILTGSKPTVEVLDCE